VRQTEAVGNPGGDGDRPVDSGRHDPVDSLGTCKTVDARLVLGRDDRAAIGVAEAGSTRVAIAGHDVQPAVAGRAEQAELRRTSA